MAQHRKFLLTQNPSSDSDQKSYCYICYICIGGCNTSPPPPPPLLQIQSPNANGEKQEGMSMILIVMLCVLGAALMLLSYLTIGRFSSRLRSTRRRNTNSISPENGMDFVGENQGSAVDHPIWHIRTIGLPQSAIDSIAVFRYDKGEGLIEGSDCSICLNEFRQDESLRLLPKCSHAFHAPCIDKWLRSQKNCPVCRAPVMSAAAAASYVAVSSVEGEPESPRSRVGNELGSVPEETNAVPENRAPINLRAVSDLADHHRMNVDRELQSVRRSASMDNFSQASIFCKEEEDEDQEEGSSGVNVGRRRLQGRSIQMGLISMKRSMSFSSKRTLKTIWKNQDSIYENKLG